MVDWASLPRPHELVNARYEDTPPNRPRPHLGASAIGADCARSVWYDFRWVSGEQQHPPALQRLFARGHREEALIIDELQKVGFVVQQYDPDTGSQIRFISPDNQHFQGACDGQGGHALYPGPLLFEFKTSNDANFKKIIKAERETSDPLLALKQVKAQHYGQMQIYMRFFQLPAAVYYVINKNSDDHWSVIVPYDETAAERLTELADLLVFGDILPPRRFSSSTSFGCRFCPHKDICHEQAPVNRSCRTCSHAQPTEDGDWRCNRYDQILSITEQWQGCDAYCLMDSLKPPS